MSNLLVTGASGFVGQALIPKLLAKGHKVYGLSRHPPAPAENLVPLTGDITMPSFGLENVPEDIDAVIHCAALLSFSARDKDKLYQANYQGTLNLLEWMRRSKISRLFHISTAFLFHQNYYETSKEMAEEAISRYPEIETTVFRPSVIIGDSKVQGLPPVAGFYSGVMAIDRVKRWFERKADVPPLRVRIRIRARRAGKLNLIPVDTAVENMVRMMAEDKTGILFITHPDPPTLKSLEKPISEAIGADVRFASRFKPNLLERAVALSLKELSPYLKGHELPSDIECPPLDATFLTNSIKGFLSG